MGKVLPPERFWGRLEPNHGDQCWLWTGATKEGRYGYVCILGRKDRAHRWAWRLTHGEIPDGMHVLHSCDVPLCCNPAHLRLGTHADNMLDRERRGRNKRRTRAGGSTKLSVEEAAAIRREWRPGRADRGGNTTALAERFGVSNVMVWKIGTGRG